MRKKHKPERRITERGTPGGQIRSPMKTRACDIAVSEMTGVALEDMCGWVLVCIDHTTPGAHRSMVMQGLGGGGEDEWAAMWLERVAGDLREAP